MEITNIRVRSFFPEGKMKAIVSATFDDVFVVHDIKVVEGQDGLFVAMPSRKLSNGEFRDVAHPITKEMRGQIETAVFNAYKEVLNQDLEDKDLA